MDVDQVLEQTQWDFFWVPPDATVVDRPELAFVSCPRDLPHLNAVTRLRTFPADLDRVLAEVGEAHSAVRSRVMVVPRIRSVELESTLSAAGYEPADAHAACAVSVSDYAGQVPTHTEVHAVDCVERLRDWHHVAASAFGEPREATEDDLRRELRACTAPDARVFRAVAYDRSTREPIASGGLTTFPHLGFGLLWAGGTVPHARGRGAYTAILRSRVEHARRAGLGHVGLYARLSTSAPIVERQGFGAFGTMVFWSRAPQSMANH